jgi:hypothetical protein
LCSYTRTLCYYTAVHPSYSPCGTKPGGPCSIGQIQPYYSPFYLTTIYYKESSLYNSVNSRLAYAEVGPSLEASRLLYRVSTR